jgi:hypothetical protein
VFAILWPGGRDDDRRARDEPPPWRWSRQDLVIDLADKIVLAQATGAVYDRLRERTAGAVLNVVRATCLVCTLQRSREESNSESLAQVRPRRASQDGLDTDVIRVADQRIDFGVVLRGDHRRRPVTGDP